MKQLIESLDIKNLFAIFVSLLLLLASCTQRNKFQDSYVIEVDGKKGLIDSLGNVIVEPRFVEITPIMRNGYATVIIDTIMTHRCDSTILSNTYEVIKVKYGYVNGSDKFLFQEPSFSEIKVPVWSNKEDLLLDFCENHSFSNGLAVVENKTFLCGYRNLKGDTIIPCIYSDAKIFSENRAVVQKPFSWDTIKNRANPGSNKYGFIDNNGKEVSKFNYISLNTLRRNRSIGVIGYTSYNDDGYEIEGVLEKNEDGSIDYTALDKALGMGTTPETAQEAISEHGMWGVEAVSTRIMDMAIQLSNGDPSMAETLREAVQKGFDAVGALDELPQVCQDTYHEIMDRFDYWEEHGSMDDYGSKEETPAPEDNSSNT